MALSVIRSSSRDRDTIQVLLLPFDTEDIGVLIKSLKALPVTDPVTGLLLEVPSQKHTGSCAPAPGSKILSTSCPSELSPLFYLSIQSMPSLQKNFLAL